MSYRDLHPEKLAGRVKQAVQMLGDCTVCAWQCRVNRLTGEKGFCRAGRRAVVSSWGPHYGEEDVLVGRHGSGTVFFAHCNLACVFCQNCDISQYDRGDAVTDRELARIMLQLQDRGCHNINLVSPSHYVPQILEALLLAVEQGLHIPLVYNTGGYDALPTLQLLDGVMDIYMPDIKFGDDDLGRRYTGAPRYFTVARRAVREMHRQVGDLMVNEQGLAVRGLLVRHLVLPHDRARTSAVLEFIAREISPDTLVNIMGQYYPAHRAHLYPELSRRITREEYARARQLARSYGLKRLCSG